MANDATEKGGAPAHSWKFKRMGGFDQVHLQNGADLTSLDRLDQKLWVALSCPASGLEIDAKTLAIIDTDGDGRIRAPEIIEAARWAGTMLKDPDDLLKGADELALAAINDAVPEGKQLLASARQVLVNLNKADALVISVHDTSDATKIFAKTRFNGDGVIICNSAEDEATQKVIADIMACLGAKQDRSGEPGIDQEKVDQFFQEAEAFSHWWSTAENDAANILPYGEQTPDAAASFSAVKDKIDDYFIRCRLAGFDARAADSLNPSQTEYEELSRKQISSANEEMTKFPLARVEAGKPLPLGDRINPGWSRALADFKAKVVAPVFGENDSLDAQEWAALNARFSAYQAWLGGKGGALVEPLGLARIREILGGGCKEAINTLIQQDLALEPEANAIASVDRLVRYHRDLYTLLRNFVCFNDFYRPGAKAIFQSGTLYLDGRSCDLCIRVEDAARHAALVNLARIYLAYCECKRDGGAEKMHIAAAITDGDADNLMVGRNGVFYDRKGRDWDATIVNIVEHPISIRQAFWAPYKKIARMIGEQIEKMAAAREKAVDASAAAGVAGASKAAEAPKPTAPAVPFDIGKFAGIFAAIGLAVGAVGTAIASVVTGLMTLQWWKMPLALAGLILIISGPSMVIAYLKLRTRNLAPLLDANGWAVNARALINLPFGHTLTKIAKLPPGAQRSMQDPFAEKRSTGKILLLLLLLLVLLLFSWRQGYLAQWWAKCTPTQQVVTQPPPPAAVQPAPAPSVPAKPAQPEAPKAEQKSQ